MNIGDLIGAAPELVDSLKGLGLGDSQINKLGSEIGSQLQGDDGFDLGDLLSGMDLQSFLQKIDVASLAGKLGVDETTVQSALQLIGPKVQDFPGDLGGNLGKLGSLAKGIFGKD